MIKCHLHDLLEDKGLTASDLEEETNIDRGTIRGLLDGSAHDIHFDVLEALCVFLKCDTADLLSRQVK